MSGWSSPPCDGLASIAVEQIISRPRIVVVIAACSLALAGSRGSGRTLSGSPAQRLEPAPDLARAKEAGDLADRARVLRAAAAARRALDPTTAAALTAAYFPELAPEQATSAVATTAPLAVALPDRADGWLELSTRGLRFRIRDADAPWPSRRHGGVRFDSPAHLLEPAGAWSSRRGGQRRMTTCIARSPWTVSPTW